MILKLKQTHLNFYYPLEKAIVSMHYSKDIKLQVIE